MCQTTLTHHPRSKATTIGGDNYEAKKIGRMKRKHAVVHGRKRERPAGPKRKMQGRGFAKVHRPMRGKK